MSKLFENEHGFFVSHEKYINEIYAKNVDKPLKINPKLFIITKQYKSDKTSKNKKVNCQYEILNNEQEYVKSKFDMFMTDFLQQRVLNCEEDGNGEALETAEFIYEASGKALVTNAHGVNFGPPTMKTINSSNFLFPENSIFFSKDISDIGKYITVEKYDLILLDPPWWNKYIRRKRKKSGDAYKMLYNNDIKNVPVESLLKENGMVIVWCTNSQQNTNSLLNEIFPKWNVKYIGKWYWMKITSTGKPVCPFSMPPGKQPFEQIVFGCRGDLSSIPFSSKLVVSVPSAIHSHKPPLIELVKEFFPVNPSCLEIFARYLLPNWTSYGNEVLRLQHESLFVTV